MASVAAGRSGRRKAGAGQLRVAIVDYGLGNLFSVKHACERVGMQAFLTSSKEQILGADLVVLPGVGAFGDAMRSLRSLDLVGPLRDIAASGARLIGVCLGMQLLMTESHEFGRHKGLGIVPGEVVRLAPGGRLKVPQVGWNRIHRRGNIAEQRNRTVAGDPWEDSPLRDLPDGEFMYFVHSFYPKPEDPNLALSVTRYGDVEFCSSLRYRNVFACQFHPERSGAQGLRVYQNVMSIVARARKEQIG